VTLSLPTAGIGGAVGFSTNTGTFAGYTVTEQDGAYTVEFLSNFYNEVSLDITIEGTNGAGAVQPLTIRRVGLHIADYASERNANAILHGTSPGTRLDFGGEEGYRIYATYYIPDNSTVAPYGLFITYTWGDGATTSTVITNREMAPFDTDGIDFIDGVFIYDNYANACDYLLYSAANSTNAPTRVSVIVLKSAPDAEQFGGVSFGSGAGVHWVRGR